MTQEVFPTPLLLGVCGLWASEREYSCVLSFMRKEMTYGGAIS